MAPSGITPDSPCPGDLPCLILSVLPRFMHRLFHRPPGETAPETTAPRAASLNTTQLKTLIHLHHIGPSTPSALGERLDMEKGSFTSVIKALEGQNLVQRRQNPEDRRSFLLTLSPQGEELAENHRRQLHRRLTHRLEALTPRERQDLTQAVQTIQTLTEKIHP